jgi:type II secretory pathway pseudopilin PulG
MSSITIISLIIVLLAALVCYAFVSQTVQQKREQRKRLLAALKTQARSFKFVLSGCPEGFLTKELTLLLQRSLIEVSEQLARVEPGDPSHTQDIQTYSSMLSETQRQPATSGRPAITNPAQVKEIKMALEELHRFVFKQEGQQKLTRNQADIYRNQIKQLVLQLTVDGYILNGMQAEAKDKLKLAVHYLDLAQKLMIREGRGGVFDQKVADIQSKVAELKERMEIEGIAQTEVDTNEQQELDDEWGKFNDDEEVWKKKQIYD